MSVHLRLAQERVSPDFDLPCLLCWGLGVGSVTRE